jgi:cytochrome c2
VSNLIQIRNFNRSWDGDLLVASLKAATLFRLRMDGERVVYCEPIWIGQRIRDIAQTKSGIIVLWTDDAEMAFVEVDVDKLEKNRRGLGFLGQPELVACLACHHFDVTGPTHLAPSLSNVLGRGVASDAFVRYSTSLKAKGGVWNPERLKEFISDPQQFAPGTTMPKLNLSPAEIEKIVTLLANIH